MSKSILAGIPYEGEVEADITKTDELEKETPKESPAEIKPKEEKAASSEAAPEAKEEPKAEDNTLNVNNVPFHKRPEFKNFKDEREAKFQKFLDEQERKTQEKFTALEKQYQTKNPQNVTVPKWFENLYGDNPEAWVEYQKATQTEREQMKSDIIREIKAEQEKASDYQKSLDNWVNENVNALADYTKQNNLPDFDKNKLMKIMVDYAPSDENGNLDFAKGYGLYMELNSIEQAKAKEKSDARKDLASQTTKTSKGEVEPKDFMTQKDFQGKGMWEIIKGK